MSWILEGRIIIINKLQIKVTVVSLKQNISVKTLVMASSCSSLNFPYWTCMVNASMYGEENKYCVEWFPTKE